MKTWILVVSMGLGIVGCTGAEGPAGPAGQDGAPGAQGPKGDQGEPGKDGASGGAVSGARLKARYIVGEDGSKERTGDWLDTTTGQTCEFSDCGPGDPAMRCLPERISPAHVWYTSPSCDGSPVLGIPDPDGNIPTPPTYGVIQALSGQPYQYFMVGAPTAVPSPAYRDAVGICEQVMPDPANFDAYEVTELAPGFFVAGAIATD